MNKVRKMNMYSSEKVKNYLKIIKYRKKQKMI